MKMTEVREIAKSLDIKTGKMKKTDLIRAIQTKEGNFPCFQTATDYCDQIDCCWRKDCLIKEFAVRVPQKAGKRESYLKRIKAELDEFNTKIAELKVLAKKNAGKGKAEVLEETAKMEKKLESLKKKLKKVTHASEDAWEEIKTGTEKAWDDMRKSFKSAFSKFS